MPSSPMPMGSVETAGMSTPPGRPSALSATEKSRRLFLGDAGDPVEDLVALYGKVREDGLTVHDLHLVVVKKAGESKKPWDYNRVLQTIPGEVAFPRLEEECAIAKKP
jgi:hypothetical protein